VRHAAIPYNSPDASHPFSEVRHA